MFKREDAGKRLDELVVNLSAAVVALSAQLEEAKNEVVAEVLFGTAKVEKSRKAKEEWCVVDAAGKALLKGRSAHRPLKETDDEEVWHKEGCQL